MFFDHIREMREMILAGTPEDRRKALEKLLPFQRADFEGLFQAMKGFPVTIRTLDPPLHEFLPNTPEQQKELSARIGVPPATIERRVKDLHELNPMLGFRGCRLGIVYPEITEMQSRAIIEAACNVHQAGIKAEPEIMIPMLPFLPELNAQAKIVHETAATVFAENGTQV